MLQKKKVSGVQELRYCSVWGHTKTSFIRADESFSRCNVPALGTAFYNRMGVDGENQTRAIKSLKDKKEL